MYIQLEKLKAHLNILDNNDDNYLSSLIDVAENAIENHINQSFDRVIYDNNGVIPTPLHHAILVMCANLYNNRESISFVQNYTIPYTFEYLLDPFKKY